jgi:cytochrome c
VKKVVILLLLLLAACKRQETGDPVNGKKLVQQYGCVSCHDIPNVSGPRGTVGPPLTHIASQQFLAGKLQNTPENMMKWLQNPQAIDPANAMPNLGLTPSESRDITAFLYTLK